MVRLLSCTHLLKSVVSGTVRVSTQLSLLQRRHLSQVSESLHLAEATFSYTARDVILYALGVGASTREEDSLKFLYENHAEFSVLPSFAVIPALNAVGDFIMSGSIGGIEANPAMLLHGEQYLELFKPLSTEDTTLVSTVQVADVMDKQSAAVVICNVDTRESNGAKVSFNQFSFFVRGAGGFGGKRTSDKLVPAGSSVPEKPPSFTATQKTNVDQAALYRLSGDRNPLHIDPSFAAIGGFTTPILHGLCSFGFTIRHVLKQYCNNDVTKFKAVKVRFSSPVIPGESIRTDMWTESKSRVIIQSRVAETDKPCLTNSYVDLHM